MKFKKINLEKGKKGQGEISVPKLVSIILIISIFVILVWGFSSGVFQPLTNSLARSFNYILEIIGIKPIDDIPADLTKEVMLLGKMRILNLNEDGKCIVHIEELGDFSLDFKQNGKFSASFYDFEKKEWTLNDFNHLYAQQQSSNEPTSLALIKNDLISERKEKTILKNFLDNLKVNIDGEDYKVAMNNFTLIVNFQNKNYVYHVNPSGNYDLGYYSGNAISYSGIKADANYNKILTAFNSMSGDANISLYGQEYPVFIEKTEIENSAGNTLFDMIFKKSTKQWTLFLSANSEYFKFIGGYGADISGSNTNALHFNMLFTDNATKLQDAINKIKLVLDIECT